MELMGDGPLPPAFADAPHTNRIMKGIKPGTRSAARSGCGGMAPVRACWGHHYISDPTAFAHLLAVCPAPGLPIIARTPWGGGESPHNFFDQEKLQ